MSLAEQLIEKLLQEQPKDPYQRALFRIKSLVDRFDGNIAKVDQHTTARARKTRDVGKLKGLIKAAKQLKLKNAVKAAQEQLALVG